MEFKLPRGFVTLIDAEDAEAVSAAGSWRAKRDNHAFYVVRINPQSGRQQFLHTFLTGYPMTDHANGDGLDNQRANLRPADASLNQANRIRTNGTSGYRGVTWHKKACQWQAGVKVHGRFRYLGLFRTAEEAARAYDDAAIEAWGEYARPNFPRRGAA